MADIGGSVRNRGMIDSVVNDKLGRVREGKVVVTRSVYKRIEEDGVVLPTNMCSGVFTSGYMDNLDHKKTSNLSNDEFHGMAITLTNTFQVTTWGLQSK